MTPDESRQVQLLAFEGDLVHWALLSEAVVSVLEERDWQGAEAPDAARVAGIAVSPTLLPVRVLLIAGEQGHVPMKVRGPLTLVAVPAADLLALPSEFLGLHKLTTQVALQGKKPSLVVLDATRLAAALTFHLPSSVPHAPSKSSR